MPREPSWSKSWFSDTTVCTWFYALAILNAIVAVAGLVGALFFASKGSKSMIIPLLISGSIGFINSWFLFLVCNRGINSGEGFNENFRNENYRNENYRNENYRNENFQKRK